MIYIKIHKSNNQEILAVCDKELIGKTFRDKDICLKITEDFYKGKLVKENKAIELMKNNNNINIVGEKSINLAIKSNLISEDNIIRIKKIPHAQIFSI